MLTRLLSLHTGLSQQQIERLLALPPRDLYDDPVYVSLSADLDVVTLRQTLPFARDAYDTDLQKLKERHGLSTTIMNGHTLGSALVGFLMQPERMPEMIEKHAVLSKDTIRETVPELINLLGTIEEGAADWQSAMAILSLPLMAGND